MCIRDRVETNQAILASNAAARGEDRRAGPPREGVALLQGLAACGVCGKRMSVREHHRCDGSLVPDYVCQREGIATATPLMALTETAQSCSPKLLTLSGR